MQKLYLEKLKGGLKWGAFGSFFMILSKIIRGAIIPKLLPLESYGLFSSISLFTRYLQFSDLGASSYFIKELPHISHTKERVETQAFINEISSWLCLSFLVTGLYLSVIAYSYQGPSKQFYHIAILLLIPTTIFTKCREFFSSYALGMQNYRETFFLSVAANYLPIVTVCIGVYLRGALGGVMGALVGEFCVLVLAKKMITLRVAFHMSWTLIKHFKKMKVQFVLSITELFSLTIDQWLIMSCMGIKSFGIYSLGLTFGWLMEAVSPIFVDAIYPILSILAREDKKHFLELLNKSILCYFLLSLTLVSPAIYIMEVIVTYYLKQYQDGMNIYVILLLSGVNRGALSLLKRGYVALGREKQYLFSLMIYSIILTSCFFSMMLIGMSFLKTVLSFLFLSTLLVIYLYIVINDYQWVRIVWKNIFLLLSILLSLLIFPYLPMKSFFMIKNNITLLYLFLLLLSAFTLLFLERKMIAGYFYGR